MERRIRVALVASVGLGDGAIFLILAHNLVRNGFEVAFYSNPFSQMAAWLPEISVHPYPRKEDCEIEFAQYDLVFADSISILSKPHWTSDEFPDLARKYIYIGVGRVEKTLRFDHTEKLRSKLPRELFERCAKLASSAGEVRFLEGDRSTTLVEGAVRFCRDVWGLQNVDKSTGLTPPADLNLQHRCNRKRILIHPFSSMVERNWSLSKFFALAKKLKKEGWKPEFCAGPKERAELLATIGQEFPAPEFANLADFSAYIYESFLLIGNDSGPVHLTSSLGVPTLSIGARGKNHRWRPDWSLGKVALPFMKLKLGKKTVWKPFLSVGSVYRTFKELLAAE